MLISKLLKQTPIFKDFDNGFHLKLIDNIRINFFEKNTEIFKEGDQADKMYIIRAGEVEVFQNENKKKASIAKLKTNDYFGEMSLIREQKRNATVITTKDTEVITIARDDFMELLAEEPSFAKKVSDSTINRILKNKRL